MHTCQEVKVDACPKQRLSVSNRGLTALTVSFCSNSILRHCVLHASKEKFMSEIIRHLYMITFISYETNKL